MTMKYKIGDILDGIINGIQQYGIFVKLDEDTEGLIHISEIQAGFVSNIGDTYKVGEKIRVMVLDIDPYSNQISLSHRAVTNHVLENRKQRVHFWTSLNVKTGFRPLKQALSEQLDEAYKRYF